MEDTLSEKELGKPIVVSDDEPGSAKACERLSDHSGDDSTESVETVVWFEFGLKKELILSSLPPSTSLRLRRISSIL